jgi:hypothetical protein
MHAIYCARLIPHCVFYFLHRMFFDDTNTSPTLVLWDVASLRLFLILTSSCLSLHRQYRAFRQQAAASGFHMTTGPIRRLDPIPAYAASDWQRLF